MIKICSLQFHNCTFLLDFLVVYDCKLNTFRFKTAGHTKQAVWICQLGFILMAIFFYFIDQMIHPDNDQQTNQY